ncbi:MAG: hemerythrin domain-containing protein [Anaerolineales bacterium]|jgi:hemerythrin-like domain-containing protein|nr:hemerythrin domain-containing protein [Anaerolineales bacterium]
MKATDVLSSEHRVIERVLDSLERATNRLENGQAVRPEIFLSAVDFIRGFADGCHHQKEEGVLFKRMEAQGMPVQGSPIGIMLSEHELGRQYTRELFSAAQDMQSGDSGADQKAIQSARSYVALLRQHIFKEDRILFPMADNVIPVDQHASVWEGFEHVEHAETGAGVHEKYLALAEALAQEMNAYS